MFCSSNVLGQSVANNKKWQNQSITEDVVPGTGADEALKKLKTDSVKNKVIVAIIDSGTDIFHEDLKDVLWVNRKEIAENGIDDDGNGYIDDIHGWSFISGPGGEVMADTYEMVREIKRLRKENADQSFPKGDPRTKLLKKLESDYEKELKSAKEDYEFLEKSRTALNRMIKSIGKENINLNTLANYKVSGFEASYARYKLFMGINAGLSVNNAIEAFEEDYANAKSRATESLSFDFDTRERVGDNYADKTERFYGDNRVKGPRSDHGTHVAGIIGAKRGNKIGMDGIADAVELMILRVVPMGDERDKDIANAIRYAADNGAKVVNMSFGKTISPDRAIVEEAIKYAQEKDVLLIHAAGNDAKNIDEGDNFPTPFNISGNRYPHWIEVGSITKSYNVFLVSSFSNYGKKSVDLFAPGSDIYATVPENLYDFRSGTSMAAPTVSGVAAVLRAHFPELSAEETRKILMESVTKIEFKVLKPGSKKKKVAFTELCASGGIVNLEKAIELAQKRKN